MFFTKKKEEKYQKEIAELKHEIAELSQIIKTQELIRLREENARLREREELLKYVHIQLKDVAYVEEEGFILVKYAISNQKVFVDGEGKIAKNNFFFAVNKLQLISLDDMKKIQKVVDYAKKINKG